MKFREPTKLHRKSEVWGTRLLCGESAKRGFGVPFGHSLAAVYLLSSAD